MIERALWQILQFFPVFFLCTLLSFESLFTNFVSSLLIFFQVTFINTSQSAELLQDQFHYLGLGMSYPKHLKNPHFKLRNLFNMQLMFFSFSY